MRIAYLASSVTLPSSPDRRSDAFEHDWMMEALRPAFAAQGMTLEDITWDDPGADWSRYAGVMIGSTWDYWDRAREFLATLDAIEAQTPLFNPAALVRWNSRKTYLRDLEAGGARLIPTLWIDEMTAGAAARAFDSLDSDDLVFKRQVGAGADGQHRLRRGDSIPAMPHPMMVQPFMSSIVDEGEISFVMIDGALSHALVKTAKPGDYRIQSLYGGTETPITPSAADLKVAHHVLSALDTPALYARVDMLRAEDGGLLLMELELIEPYLYPKQGPDLGERLATALLQRLS
ncbi:MAG: hypothetical protein AAF829_02900 [Pseudomonadota bacterium]